MPDLNIDDRSAGGKAHYVGSDRDYQPSSPYRRDTTPPSTAETPPDSSTPRLLSSAEKRSGGVDERKAKQQQVRGILLSIFQRNPDTAIDNKRLIAELDEPNTRKNCRRLGILCGYMARDGLIEKVSVDPHTRRSYWRLARSRPAAPPEDTAEPPETPPAQTAAEPPQVEIPADIDQQLAVALELADLEIRLRRPEAPEEAPRIIELFRGTADIFERAGTSELLVRYLRIAAAWMEEQRA